MSDEDKPPRFSYDVRDFAMVSAVVLSFVTLLIVFVVSVGAAFINAGFLSGVLTIAVWFGAGITAALWIAGDGNIRDGIFFIFK